MLYEVITRTMEFEYAKVVIDTKGLHYPYSIREAFELALKLDGFSTDTIDEIFHRQQDECCAKSYNFV